MSVFDKICLGAFGTTGAAVVAWRTLFPWISDDLKTIKSTNRSSKRTSEDVGARRYIIDMFEEQVARVPNKAFLLFEDRIYTYKFIDSMANRVANLARSLGLQRGDAVATIIYNEPAFVWTFLGLIKLGIIDAFINYNLRGKPLVHSLTVSEAKVIIIGPGDDLLESVQEIRDQLPQVPCYVYNKLQSELPTGYISMDYTLLRMEPTHVPKVIREGMGLSSLVCYIYTSGTTGLPKPALVNQAKAIGLSKFYQNIFYSENDTDYVVSPLYHSVAAGHALFNTIDVGATLVLRRKFSARHYWEDVRKYKVTVITYVGELCRYILRVPKSPLDGVHNVRVAVGNGLRPDIWEEFRVRFKIPWIAEFFGATEGTSTFINVTNKVGALGRWSPFMAVASKGRLGVTNNIIKYDRYTEEPLRDQQGRCIKIKPGEEGLLIAGIPPSYTGFYKADNAANEKKIIRNAFVEGDRHFNFGDLVYMDKDYFLYFRDRTGDTFRWKGENVSTREVCDVISSLDFVQDVNVYGVRVPDADGRAGMAAIILKNHHDVTPEILSKIFNKCQHELPVYARPLFLRFQKDFIVTQTMKHRKVELQDEGFDPNKISDPLYYRSKDGYMPLTMSSYQQVLSSKL